MATNKTDTLSDWERQVPTWKTAVLVATIVFVVMFATSLYFLDWVASLGLAFWFAVFTTVVAMERNGE